MPPVKALISDADGTLLDTVGLIRHGQYEAAKQYLTQRGIPAGDIPAYDVYSSFLNQVVGGSTRNTAEGTVRLLYAASPHYLDGIDFDELYGMLRPIQDGIAPTYAKAYEGLSELLAALSEAAIPLGVFTSGSAHHIVRNFGLSLPQLGLQDLYHDETKSDMEKLRMFEERFATFFNIPGFTVVTSEDTARHKPEPDSLLLAMKRLGISPEDAVVLGDHKVDMQAAVSAGAPARIGVTHGFSDEATLRGAGATHIAHSLSDLKKLLEI